MEYNAEKADRLKRKYNLAPSTTRTWKHRNHIPDHYSDHNYEVPKEATSTQLANFERLWDFDYIVFAYIEGVPYYRFKDYQRGGKNARINEKEIQLVTFAIQKIQATFKAYLKKPSAEALSAIVDLPVISKKYFFGNAKLNDKFRKGRYASFTKEELSFIKKRVKKGIKKLPFC